MYKTALRIPLVIEDDNNSDKIISITTYNARLKAVATKAGVDWSHYKTTSNYVLVAYSNDDDGTVSDSDSVGPCRD